MIMKTSFYLVLRHFGLNLMLPLMMLFFYSCMQAQEPTKNQNANEPKVHIDVNKEFDEQGNVTRYDSTYVWTWSSDGNIQQMPDSMLQQMMKEWNMPGFDMFANDPFFNLNDSLMMNPFGNMPFFDDRIEQLLEQQQRMMEELFQFPQSPMIEPQNEQVPSEPKTKGVKI